MEHYSAKDIGKFLQEEYPEVEIKLEVVKYGGEISVFFSKFKTETQVKENWREISNSIAAYYQSEINDDFVKWNIYILYLCEEEVNVSLKYLIENDKFSSRKIVIDNSSKSLSTKVKQELVATHITNSDIVNPVKENSVKSIYKSKSLIWKYISKFQPGKSKKKEIDEEVDALLETIEKKLCDEIQES